jgi:tRNA(Ile2) C34 agmatinyltransferase TiaS
MTAAVLDRPGSLFDRAAAASPFGGGRLTLEERLDAVLHETRTNGSTECPVCDARMSSTRAGAECGGCGARLS